MEASEKGLCTLKQIKMLARLGVPIAEAKKMRRALKPRQGSTPSGMSLRRRRAGRFKQVHSPALGYQTQGKGRVG